MPRSRPTPSTLPCWRSSSHWLPAGGLDAGRTYPGARAAGCAANAAGSPAGPAEEPDPVDPAHATSSRHARTATWSASADAGGWRRRSCLKTSASRRAASRPDRSDRRLAEGGGGGYCQGSDVGPGDPRLMTLPGVDMTVAAGVAAAIGDIRRFRDPQDWSAISGSIRASASPARDDNLAYAEQGRRLHLGPAGLARPQI